MNSVLVVLFPFLRLQVFGSVPPGGLRFSPFVNNGPCTTRTRHLGRACNAPTDGCGLAVALLVGLTPLPADRATDTVVGWHREAFAWYWPRKSGQSPGRPEVAAEIRDLIWSMSRPVPCGRTPHSWELRKLGIAAAQSTVARYLPRPRKPPSQTWRTFLTNHPAQTVAVDFFTMIVLTPISSTREEFLAAGT